MIKLNPVLERFAQRSPLPVMIRGVLERCLSPAQLDAWFEQVADKQYTRSLLFSTLFDLMIQVVLRQQPSLHAAYRARVSDMEVSVTSVYNKLNGLEMDTLSQLVGYASEQTQGLIEQMNARRAPLLPGVEVKILDGNCLEGHEHRLKETRQRSAAPLPGQALAVFDPALELITGLYPCEDAYTQERALLEPVIEQAQAGQLWVADRNFCTVGFLSALEQRGCRVLVREHEQLPFDPQQAVRRVGRVDNATVYEQWVFLGHDKQAQRLPLRRIAVHLDQPTRNGDHELYLLTSVPEQQADALTLARLYRERWTIERAFLHLTTELRCEVDTLAYPPAALFALACATVAFNVLGVVKGALRAVHGIEAVEQLSGYYMAIEMNNIAESLEVIIDAEDWAAFQGVDIQTLALWLEQQAGRVDMRRYRKSTRSTKKKAVKKSHDPSRPHASVARILAERKAK